MTDETKNSVDERRVDLSSGIALNVFSEGQGAQGLPILFLHGFPESHRTWRNQIPRFSKSNPVAAPDQRGYGLSDKPAGSEHYKPARLVGDVIALADALGWQRFVLVGHDWGGAVAWATALAHPDRLFGLAVVNAPHPFLFQKSLIEDRAQREASQYIREFRTDTMTARILGLGLEQWFDEVFRRHGVSGLIDENMKSEYLARWSVPGAIDAMLNWYKASPILVPGPTNAVTLPWLERPFPKTEVPVQVVWGMRDIALLPVQLAGLDELVPDLRVTRIEDAGHFAPWEAPDTVNAAIAGFLDELAVAACR